MLPAGRDEILAVVSRDGPLLEVMTGPGGSNVRRFCESVGEEYGGLDSTT